MARLHMAVLAAVSLLLVTAFSASDASARIGAVLVKDIAQGPDYSDLAGFTAVGGTLFFAADDAVHGHELWKSDGTETGTTLVKDVNPGPDSSIAYCWANRCLAAIDGTVFFAADDGVHGSELWKSDGTARGTSLVADVNPGPAGSDPRWLSDFNGRLYFSADDGVHGRELWTSDGSASGTRLVKDVVPGSSPYSDGFVIPFAVEDTLFFIANDYDANSEQLWATDGTAAGTRFLKAIACAQCDSGVDELAAGPDGLAMVIVEAGVGGTRALYRSDGTPEGTYRLEIVTWGTSAVFEGAFYYFDRAFSTGEGTTTFFKTDGTIEGTTVVLSDEQGFYPSGATVFEGRLLFFTYNWRYPPGEWVLSLWASDGTAAGTAPSFDIGTLDTRYTHTYGPPDSMTRVGDSLFFEAALAGIGSELWTTDGTPAGTYLVRDINPGEGDSRPQLLTAVDGTLFFSADDGIHGGELWKTTPPLPAEPHRSDYKNAAGYCNSLRGFLGGDEFGQRYKNHGACVKANR